jgi:hypothetical protein
MVPFEFTLKTCNLQKTLGYLVHGLIYALIQKNEYHGHL